MSKISRMVLFSGVVISTGLMTNNLVGVSVAEGFSKSSEGSQKGNSEQEKKDVVTNDKKIPSEVLNSDKTQGDKKSTKAVVLFKDGTTISDDEIKKELDDIPEQLSSKMSLMELRSFLAWKNAYKKVVTEAALRSGVANSKEIRDLIEKRQKTVAGFMLLDAKAKEMMTFEALKKNYDEVWDQNFKDTKEFSLTAITTSDKNLADKIKNDVKDEESLKKILNDNAAKLNYKEMDSRPQGMFPQEITSAVLKQGAKTVVGPFEHKKTYMLFYVKSVVDSKKKEFTNEFAEEYKKVALKDFIKQYTQELYKKYDVKVFDVNGKVVDPFTIMKDKDTEKQKEKNLVNLSKKKDNEVLATFKNGKVTVKDIKDFYKVSTLLDQTLVAMAKQFGIALDKVIIYATKLVTDDIILSAEVKATGYDTKQEVIEKMQDIGNMETQHAYFKNQVKVSNEDIKIAYDKFMKALPEEDKNDNEISLKLAFYDTREDAALALKSIRTGDEKFGTIYKEKEKKNEAIDLGYVKKRGTSPELWAIIKAGASGACIKQIIEIKGEQFGVADKNFAIIYIADRRPVTLPSLSNEAEKQYFKQLAERDKAVGIARSIIINGVKTIEGRNVEELMKQEPEYVNRMISVLLGYAG